MTIFADLYVQLLAAVRTVELCGNTDALNAEHTFGGGIDLVFKRIIETA